MKRILFFVLIVCSMSIGLAHTAQARRHYRRFRRERIVYYHRPIYYRHIYYARPAYYYSEPAYYYYPHRHWHPGVHVSTGVGIGPIHIGAGIHLHEVMPPPAGPAADPSGVSPGVNQETSEVQFAPADQTNDIADTMAIDTITIVPQIVTTMTPPVAPAAIVSLDTLPNSYSANWVRPTVATVDGFTVPITQTPMHYSPFGHGRNGEWFVHNHKGEDPTAGYGVSPRAGPLPESIGGTGYISYEE